MEQLSQPMPAVPVANPNPRSVAREYATFIALAFGITWLVWISAIRLGGVHPGAGEELLNFGSAGPAVAAVLLSRNRRKVPKASLPTRALWFALLWAPCWAVYIESDKLRGVTPNPSLRFGLIVALLAVMPAWIGSRALASDAGVRDLLRTLAVPQKWKWQAVAFFGLPVILLVPSAILQAFGVPVVWERPSGTLWSVIAYGALMFLRNLFFTAYFEEPGWRGFLLPSLQRKFPPLVASLLVWLPWALWHAPIDFGGGIGNTWMVYLQIRVIFLIPITVIITWLYNRSGGNLLTAAIFHAGMNTFPFILPYAPPVFALIFVWAGYAIFADKMWRPTCPQLGALNRQQITTP
jgi:membrane protease YdiL (CAAX protease family)